MLASLTLGTGGAAAEAEVRMCFNDWPPYTSSGPDGPSGISVEIVGEAARRAGVSLTLIELPWNRCLDGVRRGAIDAVLDAARRDEFLQGPESFSVYANTLWVRDDSDLATTDFAALRGRRIGLVDGYEYPAPLMAEIERNGIAVDLTVNDPSNLRKLVAGRVDAIVSDFAGTAVLVRSAGLPVRALTPVHSTDALYLTFNPERRALHARFDREIALLLEQGFVDAVYRAAIGVPFSRIVGK